MKRGKAVGEVVAVSAQCHLVNDGGRRERR